MITVLTMIGAATLGYGSCYLLFYLITGRTLGSYDPNRPK